MEDITRLLKLSGQVTEIVTRSLIREVLLKKLLAYLKDESGQTSTEYILLVAVVALIVFKFKGVAVEQLGNITTDVFTKANQGIGSELDRAISGGQ